jgi:hypothetical protein
MQNSIVTGRTVYADAGLVDIDVVDNDTNAATMPTFDWSGTASLGGSVSDTGASSSRYSFDPSSLNAGIYAVNVVVTDAGFSTPVSFLLKVQDTSTVILSVGADTDGDGDLNNDGIIDVSDATEGVTDSDADGIPNYLDNKNTPVNLIENQTGDLANSYLLDTDAGLKIALGSTAIAAGATGVLVSQQNIDEHGGTEGGAGVNTLDDHSNLGGFYDFEVSGLNEQITTARIVIPLQSAILDTAVYRKYNGSSWTSFVVDANNTISSAPGEPGVCPAPGSSEYTPGLTTFDYCVQLKIEDGGPNDADGLRDFVIRDPGGVAVAPEVVAKQETGKGRIGALHPVLLLVFALFSLMAYCRIKS